MYKYVPETIGINTDQGFIPNAHVTRVVAHRPGQIPGIADDFVPVEIFTNVSARPRIYGFKDAFIGSSLRMVVEINPRDEVLRRWEDADEADQQHAKRRKEANVEARHMSITAPNRT